MENTLSIDNLKKTFNSLKIAFDIYLSDKNDNEEKRKMFADSCIKRYEYTFETAWKLLKKYFKLQYNKSEEELTMNNIFRFMEAYGFTKNWLNWKKYYELRNNTAHEYDINKSYNVLNFVPAFLEDIQFLINKWESL
jgi:nucleotidyltransferase substrate binding protein (TIGR01987 family)